MVPSSFPFSAISHAALGCFLVGTFFYGIYLVLFCICIYILLNRPRNPGNTILLVTAIALFTLATVQAVINLVLGAADVDGIDLPYDQLVVATSVVYVVNNFIADGLVIYRCYVVWNNNILVTIPPTLMLIAATVLGIIVSLDLNLTAYPFFALSLATNVLVTILTAGRIWWICRRSRGAYSKTAEQRRYVSAVAILIESGMLYSATVLTYLIVVSIPRVSILEEPIFQALIQIMVSTELIQAIAPTLIIVRAGMNLRGEEMPISDTQRPILGARMVQPGLNKDKDEETVINGTTTATASDSFGADMPAIPPDVEKGQPDYGSGKTWSF
ncbi:hypothetical protein B0H14DRAFT_3157974 [Mycena olivaceomarginata]|nr:hypothetical protein B0H14DRAFT_3157974 [Mycena olivaceomarginata]